MAHGTASEVAITGMVTVLKPTTYVDLTFWYATIFQSLEKGTCTVPRFNTSTADVVRLVKWPIFCWFSVVGALIFTALKVCQGYVFTSVYLSMGGCMPHTPWPDTPQTDTPRAYTQLGRHTTPLGRHPPGRILWDTFNKRAVRIPLECILVSYKFHNNLPFMKLKCILPEYYLEHLH